MIPQINLYQKSFRPTRVWMNANTALGLVFLTLVILAGLTLYTSMHQYKMIQDLQKLKVQERNITNLLATMKNSLPTMERKKMLQARVDELELQRKSKENALALLTGQEIGSRRGFSVYFKQLATFERDRLWLNHIQISQGGRACVLVGRTLRDESIADFINSVKLSEIFNTIIFRFIQVKEIKAKAGESARGQFRFAIASGENELRELWALDIGQEEGVEHALPQKLEKMVGEGAGIQAGDLLNPLKLLKQFQGK
ncbi:MAG: hypothetical protein G8345_14155 [Magnetococcales bacterium]|nr:hypothetical protein [Magnetococcales bacterium]NGZ28020.1 hypothetical protein [Magnetococcales bacterium]